MFEKHVVSMNLVKYYYSSTYAICKTKQTEKADKKEYQNFYK